MAPRRSIPPQRNPRSRQKASGGDGSINKDEFKKAMLALGRDCDDDTLSALMGGDSLSSDAFVAAMAKMKDNTATYEEIIDAISVFDKGNGTVSAKELKNALTTMGDEKLQAGEADLLLKYADLDGDGLILYKEFCKFTMESTPENAI